MIASQYLVEVVSRSASFNAGRHVVVTVPNWQYDLFIEENAMQPGESGQERRTIAYEILNHPRIKIVPADVESVTVSTVERL